MLIRWKRVFPNGTMGIEMRRHWSFCLALWGVAGLSGCAAVGTQLALDRLGQDKRVETVTVTETVTETVIETVMERVYVPDQNLTLTATASNYPDAWTGTPGVVAPPMVSPLFSTVPPNVGQLIENGSQAKPFEQSTLQWNAFRQPNVEGFKDPSAWVKGASGSLYDLRWGAPDGTGPTRALNYGASGRENFLAASEDFWGQTLAGADGEGLTLLRPHLDVIGAWRKGWTGAGKNVLVIDGLTTGPHGPIVANIIRQIAPSATIYGKETNLNLPNSLLSASSPLLIDNTNATAAVTVPIHVTNLSFTFPDFLITNNNVVASLKDVAGFTFAGVSLSDSLVTVAAGNGTNNDGVGAMVSQTTQPLALALLNDSATAPRTIVVGALAVDEVTQTQIMADYSNFPGASPALQGRFLVASGTANWVGDLTVGTEGTAVTVSASSLFGTSYAAPRVAAYAAIVRHKFPNLSASQTASLLLDTASYDALACFPSCSPAKYGRGEASLRRALAPVGSLR